MINMYIMDKLIFIIQIFLLAFRSYILGAFNIVSLKINILYVNEFNYTII